MFSSQRGTGLSEQSHTSEMVTEQTSISTEAPATAEEQQSEMPPMGMPPQDGPSPRGREPPPPGTYPVHPGAARYVGQPPPYQAAQQPPYPQGFPPYGFPPPMYPPGGPPPFGQGPPFLGGFPGSFPAQHAHLQNKPDNASSRRKSPGRKSKSLQGPEDGSEEKSLTNEMREGAPPAMQEMPSVDPMRSAFHFFVDDMQDKLRQAALEEVKSSTKGEEVDLFLLNTNLNSRLMKEWEGAKQSVRDEYLNKEEEDQNRFMKEDEIANRHCATLTARARSPRHAAAQAGTGRKPREREESVSYENGELTGEHEDPGKKRDVAPPEEKGESPVENGESPTKKIRTGGETARIVCDSRCQRGETQ